jgi:phage terminase large subunit-like protein
MSKELVEGMDYIVHRPASKKHEMILANDAQILIIGGAMGGGKTYLQQMIGLRYIDDPNTDIVTFRRTMDEIKGQGGVWDTAEDIFLTIHPNSRPIPTKSKLTFEFPTGAKAVFKGMELVKDAKKNQGLQFTLCNFDEGTLFEWEQIEYLFQRMRSKSKYSSRIIISCNPDPDHKISELVDWYLDEEGFPDPEKEGKYRYFIRRNGDFHWGDSRKELGEKYEIPKKDWESKILSFSFIGCTIYDNPPNLINNPEYLAFLEGMNDVDKARNLYGNWYARPEGNKLFKRQWVRGEEGERVKKYVDIPNGIQWFRGWDKGYSVPSDTNKYPDYSACSPKIGKDSTGFYWLVGNYQADQLDDDQKNKKERERVYGQFRKLAGERDILITKQAIYDGGDCSVVLSKDMGAGTTDHTYTKTKLIENRVKVVEDKSAKNTPDKKIKDFLPFCNACEVGLVYIIEESFNPATLEGWYKQLEAFNGERSTGLRKDDIVDSTALGFNSACSIRIIKIVPRNQSQSKTYASDVLQQSTHNKHIKQYNQENQHRIYND